MHTWTGSQKHILAYGALVALAAFLMVGLVAVPSVRALESRGGDVVVIGPDEVIDDDLYVFARRLEMEGTVNGDLIFAGQSATIDGTVSGDLIAAGQHLVVTGEVLDDARLAGYAMELTGALGDDLLAAGFSLELDPGSDMAGDLAFTGYQALLAGPVGGDVRVAGGAVDIDGDVAGDVTVDVGGSEGGRLPPGFPFMPGTPSIPLVRPGVTLGNDATIGGDLNYRSSERIEIREGAVEGDVAFDRYVQRREEREPRRATGLAALRWAARQVGRLIALLLIGVVLLWLLPTWTVSLADIVRARPLPSLGWGFVAGLVFVAWMVAVIIATIALAIAFGIATLGQLAGRMVSLGLLVFGASGLGFGILWSYIARIVVALLLGQLIFRLFGARAKGKPWWRMVTGVVVFVLITAVPVLGWLLAALAAVLGLGAVSIWAQRRLRERRSAAPQTPTTAEA